MISVLIFGLCSPAWLFCSYVRLVIQDISCSMTFCFEESISKRGDPIQLLDYFLWAVNIKIYIQYLLIVLCYMPFIWYRPTISYTIFFLWLSNYFYTLAILWPFKQLASPVQEHLLIAFFFCRKSELRKSSSNFWGNKISRFMSLTYLSFWTKRSVSHNIRQKFVILHKF
jgi:hypothetical protein